MDHEHKEMAKRLLNFQTVPFYVVVNSQGQIVQQGGKRDMDWERIPGVIASEQAEVKEERKEDFVFSMEEDF